MMAISHLPLQLGRETFRLRLTMAGQRRLREQWKEDILTFLLSAVTDGERLCDLLTQALSWPGSDNPITDGAAFYDLLVDEGWRGQEAFAGLVFDLAECSGLVTCAQADQLRQAMTQTFARAFAALGQDE